MDVSPTYLERGTLLTNYLLSWRGYTHPIQNGDIHRESCMGLICWADQPSKKTIFLVNEIVDDDGELGPEDRYYLSLVEAVIPPNPAPSTLDSPPPPPPPRDNKGPPINVKGNTSVPATPSDCFGSHPDPDPTVNPLLGKTVTSLLCFQGPTQQDSYTVSELVKQLTGLSEGMTADEKYEVWLFRRYLQLCAAEYSVTTGDDHCVLCMGLLRWAKFPKNILTYICFESYPPASHLGERWRVRINDFSPDENPHSTPVTTLTPCATPPLALFADEILSKIVTKLLKEPSSVSDWWTIPELLFHAREEWTTQVSDHTFFTSYLHSWVGEPEPIQGAPQQSCVNLCEVGLIHWATQPNKESIYLVSEGPRFIDVAEDGGTGSPKKLWCIRLIRADTDSITSPSPPAPPPPDDDPPEDEKRKDKHRGTPGPSELFRAMERHSSGLQGSTSQGGITAPAPQSSSTLPQHNLGFKPDSAHANEGGKKIDIPPGFINSAAHVGEDVDFWEDYSSGDNSDDCVLPPPPPNSPPPPSPPGSPPDMQTCIPCGDPVVSLPTRPKPRRVTPLAQTESEIESI